MPESKRTPGRWKTTITRAGDVRRDWFVLDAAEQTLGRLASQVATVLMGKHKPTYVPYLDTGDHVIVLNAGRVRLTGRKEQVKVYKKFTGYPGGLREIPFARVKAKRPERIIEHAVRGMLPKTNLGDAMARKLKVYRGGDHPHQAQCPKPFPLKVGR
jgi:large subunit ribosomal protein L13